MIKFYRRKRQQMLSEGNTSKYLKYSIGEIKLLVVGNMISIQIIKLKEKLKERQ